MGQVPDGTTGIEAGAGLARPEVWGAGPAVCMPPARCPALSPGPASLSVHWLASGGGGGRWRSGGVVEEEWEVITMHPAMV